VASGEAQTLELACTSWAATSKSGDDAEDDEEVAARNTLERGLNWARCTFDEMILPVTLVSSRLKLVSSVLWFFCIARGRPSCHLVGGEPAQHVNSAQSGPSWRCSLS
jgi:hypothetical protein